MSFLNFFFCTKKKLKFRCSKDDGCPHSKKVEVQRGKMSDKDFTWGGPNENLCALCVNGCSQLNISGFTYPRAAQKTGWMLLRLGTMDLSPT